MIRRPLWPVFVALPIHVLRGLPCLGSFSVVRCSRHIEGAPLARVLLLRMEHQALKGASWVRSYSVVQCIRHLMAQPVYCAAAGAGLWEGEAMVMIPPALRDSAVSPCFHGCLAFLHSHFPPQSPPSHPLNPSLHSQHQPSHWDCSTVPKFQLPATAPSRGPVFLSRVCVVAASAGTV